MNSFLTPRLLAGFSAAALLAAAGLFASSRPAHSAGGPIAVTVANMPLTTAAADNPAKQPFTATTTYVFVAGDSSASLEDGSHDITVPAGKRLVIQTVSAYHPSYVAETMQIFIAPVTSRAFNYFALPALTSNGTDYPASAQPMTLYADPASTIFFTAYRSQSAGPDYLTLTVSGYLVDA